ncbi:MAG: hypothetical protein LBU91_08200, partial [Bacteroidales bacterium]|nr:hypothetical protein [Bacteroidales bacterium]
MKAWYQHKVSLIVLYTVATLVCMGAVFYFVSSYRSLRSTEKQLSDAQRMFEQTNALAVSLNAAQTFSEWYVVSRNVKFLKSYRMMVDSGFLMLDTLFEELPEEQQNEIIELSNLFEQKEILLQKMSSRRDFPDYADRLREQSTVEDTIENQPRRESKIEIDTAYTPNARGFFRKIGQLFSASSKPTQVITIRQSDSIIHDYTVQLTPETGAIDTLLESLEKDQEQQLKTIE